MINNYEFSVLIACYHGDHVDRFNAAFNSIIQNTLKPTEIILVQDGPVPEDLHNSIQRWVGLNFVKLVKLKQNTGLANALNRGLEHVTTPLVLRADADDINAIDRFERQVQLLSQGYDVVGSCIEEVDPENNLLSTKIVPEEHQEIMRYMKFRNPVNHMTAGFRVEKVRSVGGYPELHLKEDYGLWALLGSAGCTFRNSNDLWVQVIRDEAMYARRSGLQHVRSEFRLQQLLVRTRYNNFFLGALICMSRIIAMSTPKEMKKLLYEKYLRRDEHMKMKVE